MSTIPVVVSRIGEHLPTCALRASFSLFSSPATQRRLVAHPQQPQQQPQPQHSLLQGCSPYCPFVDSKRHHPRRFARWQQQRQPQWHCGVSWASSAATRRRLARYRPSGRVVAVAALGYLAVRCRRPYLHYLHYLCRLRCSFAFALVLVWRVVGPLVVSGAQFGLHPSRSCCAQVCRAVLGYFLVCRLLQAVFAHCWGRIRRCLGTRWMYRCQTCC